MLMLPSSCLQVGIREVQCVHQSSLDSYRAVRWGDEHITQVSWQNQA